VMRVRLWLFVHGVTSVWAACSNEEVVFRREIRGHMPFTFASVLSTHEHINEPVHGSPVKSKTTGDANEDTFVGTALGINDNVSDDS